MQTCARFDRPSQTSRPRAPPPPRHCRSQFLRVGDELSRSQMERKTKFTAGGTRENLDRWMIKFETAGAAHFRASGYQGPFSQSSETQPAVWVVACACVPPGNVQTSSATPPARPYSSTDNQRYSVCSRPPRSAARLLRLVRSQVTDPRSRPVRNRGSVRPFSVIDSKSVWSCLGESLLTTIVLPRPCSPCNPPR